jgi:heme-degrading monooxygenase HmoA
MAATIARVWSGWGSAAGVDRYCHEHFAGTLLPQLRALDGFSGARLLVRTADDGQTQVVVSTFWASLAAIGAFAGPDATRAVVEPVVYDLLDRFDERVVHFEVALDAT